jgi:ubiquinone/menaquinone biosynthesis C-methylase UbiE
MQEQVTETTSVIKDYYRARASTKIYATSPDFHLREVEIEFLGRRLRDGISVLDVGCGNGYSTLCFAVQYKSSFVGVDFVPEMVSAAKQLAGQFTLKGACDFQVGDVTQLNFPDASFDMVISQRCLLNLPSKELQWKAMEHIARVLKPGGLYLMLEGTLQGLSKLNDLRAGFGLDPIPEADPKYNSFSNKFDEKEMLAKASAFFKKNEDIQRFGMYYFISRIIHPLMVKPQQPKYDAPINAVARQICSTIPNYQDIGHVALFIFRK